MSMMDMGDFWKKIGKKLGNNDIVLGVEEAKYRRS